MLPDGAEPGSYSGGTSLNLLPTVPCEYSPERRGAPCYKKNGAFSSMTDYAPCFCHPGVKT